MKLTGIRIQNFKSIEDVTIPVRAYGEGDSQSNTLILLGINESGKSNILEAIKCAAEKFNGYKYAQLKCKHHVDSDKSFVSVCFVFDDVEDKIKTLLAPNIETHLVQNIRINSVTYCIILNSRNNRVDTGWWADVDISQVNMQDFEWIDDRISRKVDGRSSSYKQLTIPDLRKIVVSLSKDYMNQQFPEIVYWKSSPSYLVNENVPLLLFSSDNDICIPLRNMFYIAGYKTKESIQEAIASALSSADSKAELRDRLSDAATEYVNNIWKEHEINLRVEFDGDKCSVLVEDKNVEHRLYTMDKRSDGFKQFISLILSLSSENASERLKNAVILLDEPEVHLHPSGVRYMRDELLKIGRNNYVFITTHSHYMVDTDTIERHAIVEKQKVTRITPMLPDSNIYSDEVLGRAFGLNFMKELMPKRIIIVEGGGDMKILEHTLRLCWPNLNFVMKPAGGCSKVPTLARFVHNEKIESIIVLDDDDEGRKICKEVVDAKIADARSTFTLRALSGKVVEKGTIEDLLDRTFVEEVIAEVLQCNVSLDSAQSVISQIRASKKVNGEQLESFKKKLSDKFVSAYSDAGLIETACPVLVDVVASLAAQIANS